MITEIENLPDVSFIDEKTLDDVQEEMITAYQDRYKELTGKTLTLRRADPEALKLYACSIQIYTILLHIDFAGKMDLLKYAYGDFLDNLGALRGVSRLEASAAVCTVRFTLSAEQESVVTIPAGTKVSNGELYFETDELAEIAIGDSYVDVACTCQTAGEEGNGLLAGSIDTLVDNIAYIDSVTNLDETSGGSDTESDEDFADRIYLAPSSYSVAGPKDAYIYHAQSYNSDVGDVEVTSPDPGEVVVCVLMADGEIPTDTFLAEIEEYLSSDDIRPLTDQVSVVAPAEQSFDIDVSYYVSKSDSASAVSIQTEVAAAIEEYIEWQTCTIGRDINPSVLIQKMMDAGAKRVEVTSPVFTVVPESTVARVGSRAVTYGGVEDD
ncbi:MAG: baseplate J/gp47 family protein [Clostridiales bacterium]|nr:baseplate J/gp47 family protein [Clostridiales bacterium]